VADARSQARAGSPDGDRKARAQAWLRHRAAVMWWLDLAGLDDWVYDALLTEAGLEEDTP
jgi:hypothetical protein